MGFEPTTYSLGRCHSTTELRPLRCGRRPDRGPRIVARDGRRASVFRPSTGAHLESGRWDSERAKRADRRATTWPRASGGGGGRSAVPASDGRASGTSWASRYDTLRTSERERQSVDARRPKPNPRSTAWEAVTLPPSYARSVRPGTRPRATDCRARRASSERLSTVDRSAPTDLEIDYPSHIVPGQGRGNRQRREGSSARR